MINNQVEKSLQAIWDEYSKSSKLVKDTKGNVINDIDSKRLVVIKDLKNFIQAFIKNEINAYEFKRLVDSCNKRNNLWGFTATKGQMFFNQLLKFNEADIENLTKILKESIVEPKNIKEALEKIHKLEDYTAKHFAKSKDKRRTPNPRSVAYFLSYFWQVYNHERWPIAYTSLINSFKELGIWKDFENQVEEYEYFYNLNEEVKRVVGSYAKNTLQNWDVEHALWIHVGKPVVIYKKARPGAEDKEEENEISIQKANFDINEYLIPRVANLIKLGEQVEKNSTSKGSEFEKLVSEIFRQLDFEVEELGQGTGRNPDLIAKFREENTAFIIDAKAYVNGYSMGTDDRAIREYINHHCPKLQKDGYKKIGFIIVSNSFKSSLDEFISEITWNSEIKRFILLESEALLYLLAYKTKNRDKVNLTNVIDCLVHSSEVVTAKLVIDSLEDV